MKKEHLAATLAIMKSIKETDGVPEGELYAVLMNYMDLATFTSMVRDLVAAEVLQYRSKHYLEPGKKLDVCLEGFNLLLKQNGCKAI